MGRIRSGLSVVAAVVIGAVTGCAPGAPRPVPPPITAPTASTTAGGAPDGTNVLYLHHSTGETIWKGGVPEWFAQGDRGSGAPYRVVAAPYPHAPYPWSNDPSDYWRLWVEQPGATVQGQEPLEELTRGFDVVVVKHCFTGSDLTGRGSGPGDPASSEKTLVNYQAQYEALKARLHEFPQTRFVLWTLPPRVPKQTSPESARLAEEFTTWVREVWDEPGDNIHLWDYRALASPEGALAPGYAVSEKDSHPSEAFARTAAPALGRRIVDIVEGRGDTGSRTGT